MARRYYDWHATMSRQTGTQGEVCMVIGAKNIGKTFGLRMRCVSAFMSNGTRFCEICRTKEEVKEVRNGYFDKLQALGCFKGYIFKINGKVGYCAKEPARNDAGEYVVSPRWEIICYFVALTAFQVEKKRTYLGIDRYIFDEAVIDRKDRYHRYLPNEYLILMNLLDSISRQQPGQKGYRVYLLGNACDLTCPYLRHFGVSEIPKFGYSFHRGKSLLLHYVEPWDSEEMMADTLVGRMLKGSDEARMMYENAFDIGYTGDVARKPGNATYKFSIRFEGMTFAIWMCASEGLAYVTGTPPRDAWNVMTLTKQDSTLDYMSIPRTSDYLRALEHMWYEGLLRFDKVVTKDMFFKVLDFLGIK